MEPFEALLLSCLPALERYVKFRVSDPHDAQDVIQETCVCAHSKRDTLKKEESFKPWLLAIARNKCKDYYKERAKRMVLLPSEVAFLPAMGIRGKSERSAVRDTLRLLKLEDQQVLYLYYFQELPQAQIARRLGVPLGTVKSRLHYAKKEFKEKYPCQTPETKGENPMKKMPDALPSYTIEPLSLPPFLVRWEEIMGWFIVPREGEKLSWAMYDFPQRLRTEQCDLTVTGPAEVHGVRGVEILSLETDPMECNSAGGQNPVERRLVAQLTDTHCRILSESHMEDGVKKYYTFLDGEAFLNNWGFGEDNCGNEVNLKPKGDIERNGSAVTAKKKPFLLDVVGRYQVTIGGKSYDTVCVMDIETYNEGTVSEQYLDENGKTILWRRFNRDDWHFSHYQKRWSEMLPDNERITVNGETCVHWYDCITDYIL